MHLISSLLQSQLFLIVFSSSSFIVRISATDKQPYVYVSNHSIEVGPGPNALRLKSSESFFMKCQIQNVFSYDIVSHVDWTYENEVDELFRIETLDNDDIDYDHVSGETTYRFDHHPTSADAGVYNCTYYQGTTQLARGTIRLTCDPVPKEGARSWKGLREDDPFRRDYKHVPSYTVYPGDEQTLECRATAYPKPKFQWFRVTDGVEGDDDIGTARRIAIPDRSVLGKDDTSSSEEDESNFDEHVIANGDVLRISNARFDERGYYCCTANNSDDYSLNLYFLIRVKNPLSFLWPLLGIGIITVSLALVIGISEHLRRKADAKEERQLLRSNEKSMGGATGRAAIPVLVAKRVEVVEEAVPLRQMSAPVDGDRSSEVKQRVHHAKVETNQ